MVSFVGIRDEEQGGGIDDTITVQLIHNGHIRSTPTTDEIDAEHGEQHQWQYPYYEYI